MAVDPRLARSATVNVLSPLEAFLHSFRCQLQILRAHSEEQHETTSRRRDAVRRAQTVPGVELAERVRRPY